MTDGPREIGTKAFGDRRNGILSVTLSHHWGTITQPGDYTSFERNGVGRRSTSGSTNNSKDVREAKEFTGRQQSGIRR